MDWRPIQGGVLRNTLSHFVLHKPKIYVGVSLVSHLAHMQTLPLVNDSLGGGGGELHCDYYVRVISVPDKQGVSDQKSDKVTCMTRQTDRKSVMIWWK